MESVSLNLNLNNEGVSTEYYAQNAVWNLNNITVELSSTKDRFTYMHSEYTMEDTNINLHLSRRPLYFMINGIFPCKF
jgi:hypothetical protein